MISHGKTNNRALSDPSNDGQMARSPSPCSYVTPLLLASNHLAWSTCGVVCSGHSNEGVAFVDKEASEMHSQFLISEAEWFGIFRDILEDDLLTFHGMYCDTLWSTVSLFLILSHAGRAVKSWSELSPSQGQSLQFAIHRLSATGRCRGMFA